MIFILFFGECLNFRENMRCFCAKTFFFSESILELCSGPCPREDLSSESRYLAFALDFFVPLASTLCPRLHLCHVQNKPFAFSGKLCDACVRALPRDLISGVMRSVFATFFFLTCSRFFQISWQFICGSFRNYAYRKIDALIHRLIVEWIERLQLKR